MLDRHRVGLCSELRVGIGSHQAAGGVGKGCAHRAGHRVGPSEQGL